MPHPREAKTIILRIVARWLGMAPEEARRLVIRHVKGYRIAFRPKTSDEEVLAQAFQGDILAHVPEFTPRLTDVVLDVGAHLGGLSLLVAPRVKHVYALEPRRDTFALLRLNLLLNFASNISAERLALSDNNGQCELFYAPEGMSWGDSIVFDHSRKSETVPCLSLSTFCGQRKITKIHFAKFNCEGAEFPILLSSDRRTLSVIEKMLVLYHCDLAPETSEKSIIRHLEGCGFRTTVRNRTATRGWIIAERV
jgi:FkbM family methyltransferase